MHTLTNSCREILDVNYQDTLHVGAADSVTVSHFDAAGDGTIFTVGGAVGVTVSIVDATTGVTRSTVDAAGDVTISAVGTAWEVAVPAVDATGGATI